MPEKKKSGTQNPKGESRSERKAVIDKSYWTASKLFEDAFDRIYKPWIDANQHFFEKAADLSKDASPEKYREFYDDWTDLTINTMKNFYPASTLTSQREMLEKVMASAEETREALVGITERLRGDIEKTREIFLRSPDSKQLKETYQLWSDSYGKMVDDIVAIATKEDTKSLINSLDGVSSVYVNSMIEMIRLSKESFAAMTRPLMDSMMELNDKMMEITDETADSKAYKEFYEAWMRSYQETFGRLVNPEIALPSKEAVDDFLEKTDTFLNMYKTWISALEKIADKTREMAGTGDGKMMQEFSQLWTQAYEKAFDSFFDSMPAFGPMARMMDPVKNAAKIYSENIGNYSKVWSSQHGKQQGA